MRRWGVSLLLLGWLLLSGTLPASAGVIYCKTDPVVMVGGTTLDLSVGIPLKYVELVNGPVAWEIQTPPEVDRHVVVYDPGFNLQGTTVKFTDGGSVAADGTIPVKVKVTIPINKTKLAADEVVPTEMTVIAVNGNTVLWVGSVEGTSDLTQVKLEFRKVL